MHCLLAASRFTLSQYGHHVSTVITSASESQERNQVSNQASEPPLQSRNSVSEEIMGSQLAFNKPVSRVQLENQIFKRGL